MEDDDSEQPYIDLVDDDVSLLDSDEDVTDPTKTSRTAR